MLSPFGGLKCTSNWEKSPGGESPELTMEDASPIWPGTASGCHSVSWKVLLPVGANWQTFLFSKIDSYFACCSTLIYNVLVKRRKLLGVNILGLLYDRSPQSCGAASRVWLSAADTWSFCAPFCPGIQDTGKLCIAVLQWSDPPLRRSTAQHSCLFSVTC